MGWFETRGALLRQLRGVLEWNGWEDDVGNYEYLAYRKGGWYPKDSLMRTGGVMLNCTITPCRPGSRPTITGYWVNFRNPIKKPDKRRKLRRFRTPIGEGINEAKVLSKLDDLFKETK